MFIYKPSRIEGDAWVRTNRIIIENPHNEYPEVKFVEQQVLESNGDVFFKEIGILSVPVTPESFFESFKLLDPGTDEFTETEVSLAAVYNIIKSAYIHFALKRDSPPVVPNEEEVIEEPTEGGEY